MVELVGLELVATERSKRCVIMFRDDFSDYSWICLLPPKQDTLHALEQFLTDTRMEGSTREMLIDDGFKFRGEIGAILGSKGILSESIPRCS